MKTASVYDVQHNFSRILSWTESGETVVISRNRVPVARLVPLRKKKKSRAKMPDFMARLKEDYGDHVSPDSQPILDELREDRF
jgi:antitoxin (DNA-binding transcriptional repressor) of toxin-antitoxin stability system